jgi:hypothetical protein
VPEPIEYDPFEMDWPWPGMVSEPEASAPAPDPQPEMPIHGHTSIDAAAKRQS